MDGQAPHFHGHRQRLRGRFVKSGLAGFADHEIIELLLTFAHNHPNGDVPPTEQDKVLTRALVLAATTVQIKVLAHLIISPDNVFSFRQEGLL